MLCSIRWLREINSKFQHLFRRLLNNVVKPINSVHHIIKAAINNILIGALHGQLSMF